MSDIEKTYTYRCGQKVLNVLPENLDDSAIVASEVSSASTRLKTSETELESLMERSRRMASTHHAYYVAKAGKEFLITDRIFVTFEESLSKGQKDEFAGRYGFVKRAAADQGKLNQWALKTTPIE